MITARSPWRSIDVVIGGVFDRDEGKFISELTLPKPGDLEQEADLAVARFLVAQLRGPSPGRQV